MRMTAVKSLSTLAWTVGVTLASSISREVEYCTETGKAPEARPQIIRDVGPLAPSIGPCSNLGYPKLFAHTRAGNEPKASAAVPSWINRRLEGFMVSPIFVVRGGRDDIGQHQGLGQAQGGGQESEVLDLGIFHIEHQRGASRDG